jgi:hypothetical protein
MFALALFAIDARSATLEVMTADRVGGPLGSIASRSTGARGRG